MGARDAPSQKANSIAIDPITPQNVYLAGPDGLFRSPDGGLTWEAIGVQVSSQPLALTLDPRHPAQLFALFANGTLLRSEDSGTTWVTLEIGS